MTSKLDKSVRVEKQVQSCYATWSRRYYDEYYRSESAYPPVHVKILRDLLQPTRPKTLVDAGCGPASMLRDLVDLGADLYGFDLTLEMVDEARRVFSKCGLPPDRIWQGSVLDRRTFFAAPNSIKAFDAAISFGVLPHIPAGVEPDVLSNMVAAVRPGGLVIVEARNALFGLFTLNRYSSAFFKEMLIDVDRLRADAGPEAAELEHALMTLDERFRMDIPPVRKGYDREPGYDEVLSHTHNPFVLRQVAEAAGLKDVQVLFYHYHALPPMFQPAVPELFRRASIAMEDPRDWRGHFMASAFILAGRTE